MRQILIGDVLAAAEALSQVQHEDRANTITRLIEEAHAAHSYHKRLGRPHPCWGNGSLMARVMATCRRESQSFNDSGALHLLSEVSSAIAVWKTRSR
jgi:hypothetical protein